MREKRFRTPLICYSVGMVFLLLVTGIVLLATEGGHAEEKITVGGVEDVLLLPWRVKLPARIDTGAATSSLDARELKIQNNMAEFKLPKKYGDLRIYLPVIGWQDVRSADFKEKRPVVQITLCLGPKILPVEVNLNDRSTVKYPLILGRNALKDYFVVDCGQSHCLPPSCAGGSPK